MAKEKKISEYKNKLNDLETMYEDKLISKDEYESQKEKFNKLIKREERNMTILLIIVSIIGVIIGLVFFQ